MNITQIQPSEAGSTWLTVLKVILIIPLLLSGSCKTDRLSGIHPVSLRCEYQLNPIGIDILKPSLSWLFKAPDLRGQKQTAYQILVASDPEILRKDKGDLWDTGTVNSDQNIHVIYSGQPLKKLTKCFWKVRVWDGDGQMSGWSDVSRWEMGLLNNDDWQGNWIGRKAERVVFKENINGYCSVGESIQDKNKWIQVDMGEITSFDKILVHPALPVEYPDGQQSIANAGFGFPLRFRIDISNNPDFIEFKTVMDKTGADFPNPGQKKVIVDCRGSEARFVRFTSTKLWNSNRSSRPFYFALGELQIIREEKDISYRKVVTASDSREGWGWGLKNLADSVNLVSEEELDHESLLLRREIDISKKINSATAFICGLGYYEFNLNGRKVGDHELDPGFTDYDKRVLYASYDITENIKSGINCFGIILGGGWYDPATRDAWGFHSAPWVAQPKLLLNIVINYSDNTKDIIVSDSNWKLSEGPIVFNSIRSGEIYDSRLEKKGWNLPVYDDSNWKNAKLVPPPKGKLVSQQLPPVRATQLISPVNLTEPLPGVYVYDLGVNLSGWVNFKISGEEGDTILLFYNEQLTKEGTVLYGPHAWWTYGKYQTDRYICSGRESEVFEPRFTYHGFRYVQITGLKNKPLIEDLKGVWVHTDPERVGEFSCSNPKINKVQELIIRTQLCNIHSIPTDCPHREKIGWMGDGLFTMEEAICNFNMATFYIKWFNDMLDAQETDGHVPPIIPNPGWIQATSAKNNGAVPAFSDPWWGGAIIMTPWYLYQYYGDRRHLESGYDAMKAYLDWIGTKAKEHIFIANLGDWIEPAAFTDAKQTPKEQVGTSAYFYFARLMSRIAILLNKTDDAKKYDALADNICTKYNETFFNETTGIYAEDSQTAHVIPLLFDMVPEGKKKMVEQNLLSLITEKNNSHLNTGFIGTPFMFKLLTDLGYADLAYTIATQEDHPGWFYMLNNGATTIWEVWDAMKQVDHSRNHPAFGSIGAWYFQSLAGIQPDPEGPGFKKIIIKPEIAGDLKWARATYTSINGKIESDWKIDSDKLFLTVTIPVNTTATVYIPAEEMKTIHEGGQQVDQSSQVLYIGKSEDKYVFKVGSGTYNFQSDYHK